MSKKSVKTNIALDSLLSSFTFAQEERKGTAVKEDGVLDNTMMKVLNVSLTLLFFYF